MLQSDFFNLLSVMFKRRKPLHQISDRHRRRIVNMYVNNVPGCNINPTVAPLAVSISNVEGVEVEVQPPCPLSDPSLIQGEKGKERVVSNTSSSGVLFSEDFEEVSEIETLKIENSLNEKLASWAVEENITQTALSNLLKILRTTVAPNLPLDPRTSCTFLFYVYIYRWMNLP